MKTRIGSWIVTLLLAVFVQAAQAVDESELLPVEQAFQLQAKAVSRERIDFEFTIAPGYYLYKHRMAIAPTDSAFKFNPLQLPNGKPKRDEFFGDVEIYLNQVVAILTGASASDRSVLEFNVKYQGCAEAGVCYPPQNQRVYVQLPKADDPEDENNLPPVNQVFQGEARALSRERFEFEFSIAPGFYLVRDSISIHTTPLPLENSETTFPKGVLVSDKNRKTIEVYQNGVVIGLKAKLEPQPKRAMFLITLLGCHQSGKCYDLDSRLVTLNLPPALESGQSPPKNADEVVSVKLEQSIRSSESNIEPAPAQTPLINLSGNNSFSGMDPIPADANQSNDPLAALKGQSNPNGLAIGSEDLPLPPEQAFVFEGIASTPGELLLRFSMPKNYYLYRDKTSFAIESPASGIILGAPRWPTGVNHRDEHFGEVVVYFDRVEIPLTIARASGSGDSLRLSANFQGCENDGICYPPMTRSIEVALPKLAPGASTALSATEGPVMQATPTPASQTTSEQDLFSQSLKSGNKLKALLVFFLVGIGLAFTPCVFPMVPILSGLIAGHGEQLTHRKAFTLSLVYVLANALVFAVIGVIAGLAGQNLAAILQKPAILAAFAGLFVLLALSMFGFYELQVPTWLQNRINQWSNNQKSGSYWGVAIMGLLSALLVGPCVAPPLAGAVLYISQERDAVLGGVALFVMAMGMGVPLIAFGMGAGHIMPRAGAWMETIKAVFGFVFLWLALWMLERVLDPFWIMFIAGVLLISQGIHMRALDRLPEHANGWQRTGKALGVVFLVLGAIELIGAASGGRDFTRPLSHLNIARAGSNAESLVQKPAFRLVKNSAELDAAISQSLAQNKPVLFDFYADWCVACKEMEKYTFTDAKVAAKMGEFTLLKVDVTAQNPDDVELQQRFQIVGPPATLFFVGANEEQRHLRLVGYEKADAFGARLDRAVMP